MFLNFRHLPLAALAVGSSLHAAPEWKAVEPLLAAKCYECHNAEKTKGDVDLKKFAADPQLAVEFDLWQKVKDSIENGDMPPKKAKALDPAEQDGITAWVTHSLDALAEAKSGDPGPVTMRRLTNAEYDHTIRDLTGHDYALAQEFQTDGGGGEGFTNTGDVLFMSPAAIDKYFNAARKLADLATIMPGTGIAFHPNRIGLRGPEQVKAQAEQGLYIWYQQKATPHLPKDFDDKREADYMLACWKHKHAQTLLPQLAKDMKLNVFFLENWWKHLNNTEPKSRFLDLTRVPWRELPADEKTALERIRAIQADLLSWNDAKKPGSGVQRRQQDSDGIRAYPMQSDVAGKRQAHLCIGDSGDGNKGDIALITKIEVSVGKTKVDYYKWLGTQQGPEIERVRAAFGKHPLPGRRIEPQVLALAAPVVFTLPLPEGAHWLRADTRLDMKNPEVEEATVQWTIATGTPRDLTKVMPGVITVWKRGTLAARRTMGEFNSMKQAFPDMMERRLEIVAQNMYRSSPGIGVYYFSDEQFGQLLGRQEGERLLAMKKDWGFAAPSKLNAQQQKDYDAAMVWHLRQFAKRAWRRPMSEEEFQKIDALYFDGRSKELDRESAAREVIVRVLVSPHFLFKAETLPLAATGEGDVKLNAYELASRLSYFLWASMPDWELRKAAEDGSLLKPEVLAAQTKRLLRDPKAAALAKEFAGQWLKFSGFDAQSSVDEKMFPPTSATTCSARWWSSSRGSCARTGRSATSSAATTPS